MSDTSADNLDQVAPADLKPRARWPKWQIALAYAALFLVALGAVWTIDGHVLTATPRPVTHDANPNSAPPSIEWKSKQGQ